MRFLYLFVLLFFVQLTDAQSISEQAQAAYQLQDAKKYEEAILAYDAILQQGYQSADLHFNKGMAHYQEDELGYAILHLEKASRLAPNNKAVSTNLRLIRNEQEDGIMPVPRFFVYDWWLRIASFFRPNNWAILALLLLLVGTAGIAASVWYKGKTGIPSLLLKWRKSLLPIGIAAIFLSLTFVYLGHSRKKELLRTDFAVVISPEADVHIAPDASTDIDFNVHQGLRIRIHDQHEGWTKIALPDGRKGWLRNSLIATI